MPRRPREDAYAKNPTRVQAALIAYIRENELSVNDWSKRSGLGESTLRMALKKEDATITYSTLSKLAAGEGKTVEQILGFEVKPPARLVGKIGAGAMVSLFDGDSTQGYEEEVEYPEGLKPYADVQCLEIEGDSMYPLENGWRVYFRMLHDGVTEAEIGKLCVVKLADGRLLLKKLLAGSTHGRFDLESWNAPLIRDAEVVCASLVLAITQTR